MIKKIMAKVPIVVHDYEFIEKFETSDGEQFESIEDAKVHETFLELHDKYACLEEIDDEKIEIYTHYIRPKNKEELQVVKDYYDHDCDISFWKTNIIDMPTGKWIQIIVNLEKEYIWARIAEELND